MLGIVDASWPRIITSGFLFVFIVLQSILSGVSGKGGFALSLTKWGRLVNKDKAKFQELD
jgi:hypothetical protein